VGSGRAQDEDPGGEEEGAGDDHCEVAETVGEATGGAGDDRRPERAGESGGAGLEHGVAPDRGEEEDVAEDQREEGGSEEEGAEIADREGAVGEEGRLDDRARVGAAAGDHHQQQHRPQGERAEHRGRGPAPVVALDDAEGDRGKAAGQGEGARQVGKAGIAGRA